MKSLNAKQYAVLLQQSLDSYTSSITKNGEKLGLDLTLSLLLKALVPVVKNLEKTGRLKLFPDIIQEFEKITSRKSSSDTAFVYSSVALTNDQKNDLKDRLSKLFKSDIEIDNEVDESMPEGILIKYKDTLIDGTVITQLKKSLS